MQTILGSGGVIGTELAAILPAYTDKIRLFSRNPARVNEADELMKGDLMREQDVMKAVEGAKVVYLTAGLAYRLEVWEKQWPVIMENVISACQIHNARLVFFDNIYMYDPGHIGYMNETTPVRPGSKKGKIRASIAQMLMEEVEKGKLTALIARSADFYGPGTQRNSMLSNIVFNKYASKSTANWPCSLQYKHTFTFTPDAAKGTALLANATGTYNQVWHLPTSKELFTGKDWIQTIASEMGVKPKVQVAPVFMFRLMGTFNPVMKELVEMLYQYDRDYVFDSTKFEKRFEFYATPYLEGIRHTCSADYN
jgi:nucleoside-diphosphate-sugar epimerase